MAKSKKDIVISEDHEAMLKTVLQLTDKQALPNAAAELYNDMRVSLRRAGHSMSTEFIALVPVMLNRAARPEPQTFIDVFEESTDEILPDRRVIAKFRNKWQAGRFVRVDSDKVVVILDDDTAEERKSCPTLVRLATRADVQKLGEKE